MTLPIVKRTKTAHKGQTAVFGGLNVRDGAKEHEYLSCRNLSLAAYPSLAPREPRAVYGTYTEPGDIFEWNGHVVVVDGYNLLFDGEVVGNVTPGEKQFAVVNTRLVVWPDKVYFDLEERVFRHMDAGVVSDSADPSAYTGNTLTLGESNVHAHGNEAFTTVQYLYSTQANNSYVYAKTYSSLSWDGSAWSGEGEAETEIQSGWAGKFIKFRANDVAGVYNLNVRSEEVVNVFGKGKTTHAIREYSEDMAELYAEIVSVRKAVSHPEPEAVYRWTVTFRVISAGDDSDKPLSEVFEVGDWVTLKGVPGSSPSKEYKITEINDETRTLTFPEDSFTFLGDYYYELTEAKTTSWRLVYYMDVTQPGYENGTPIPATYKQYGFVMPDLPAGSILYSDKAIPASAYTAATVKAWNSETGEVTTASSELLAQGMYSGNIPEAAISYTFTRGSGIISWAVEVNKGAPGMDFICAHNNRLYGVSNSANVLNEDGTRNEEYKTRIIYVSELGIPNHFTTFEGVDTDSYQVAEASNGDFTGCISYGDQVLFFKEHKVLKFYGDYPSAMGFTYDDIEGVKAGCNKSMVIVNNVLYYAGLQGYYAYGGASPELLSYKLDGGWDNARACTDGHKIMLCGYKDDVPELLSYSLEVGAWVQEDELAVQGFALIGGKIHMIADRNVYTTEGGDEAVEWSAEFHPFTEGTFNRKAWRYLRLRAESEAGAQLSVSVKIGDRRVQRVFKAAKTGCWTANIPLPPMRDDRMSVELWGKGRSKVRALEREYYLGSEF